MENAGSVALNESLFLGHPEQLTEDVKFTLAFVALKELAHQWFGNLVGMKWWNELWLKDSLAAYMAGICLSETNQFPDYKFSDQIFMKFLFSAVSSDIRSTTHPISGSIKHTIDAENSFDCISYEKGASFIKMLNNFIGREAFKLGLKEYFAKYKY